VAEIRIPGIRRILRITLSDRALRRDVADEIAFHIDQRAEELRREGESETDARARAIEEYGDLARSQRELLDVDRRRMGHQRREEMLMSFIEDLRYAARSLIARPALLSITTLALSIGIGANAIMFGVVDQLLLRPPAHVMNPDAVKRINFRDNHGSETSIGQVTTYPVLPALRERTTAYADISAYSFENLWTLGAGADARSIRAQMVSGNFFRLLGVRATLGRTFVDSDDTPPVGQAVAVVSDGFWKQELGAATDVVGRQIRLQGKLFRVVGVAPEGFSGIDRKRVDVWVPISSMANETMGPGWHNTTNNWWAQLIARIAPGASETVAADQATAAYRVLVEEWNEEWRDSTSAVVHGSIIGTRTPEGLSPESKVSLWLMGVSVIVLLIACANVANLLIARTMQRRREIAVRLALGVSRGRLLRLLLAEAGLLAVLAAGVALAVAVVASNVVQDVLLPNIVWNDGVLDRRMLAFTLVATIGCVLLAGIAPAVDGLGTRVSENLKGSSRQVAGGRNRVRFTLMAVQAALSIILLIGAGLFVTSLRKVVSRDVGIDRERVLQVTMPLTRFGFDSLQVAEIYRAGTERVRSLPGVADLSVVRLSVPMGSASATSFSVPGIARKKLDGGGPYQSVVGEGFFRTVGVRLLRGRTFTEAEERVPSNVIVVNELLANAYWPGQDPIGQCIRIGRDSTCSQIVGVVGNVMQFRLIKDDRAMVYAPHAHPAHKGVRPSAMLVRVSGDPASTAQLIRSEMQRLAANMPYVRVESYASLVAPQLQPWRLGATMFTLFGVIALIIASVGLYSVMAFWVSQRTQEIGVRMALGAQRFDVVRLIAWQSSRAVGIGLAVGALLAAAASRRVGDLLYETSPTDPAIYLGAAVVLALATVIASLVPTRRSVSIDPAVAIRNE
jgi:putative ABC transport system permease protein